jgi:hypothetical protein
MIWANVCSSCHSNLALYDMNVQNQLLTSTAMRYVLLRHCVRIRLRTLVNVISNRKQPRCHQNISDSTSAEIEQMLTSDYTIVA